MSREFYDPIGCGLNSGKVSIEDAYTMLDQTGDILDTNIKAGIYSCNPNVANLPINTYGRCIITKTVDNQWIFVEFFSTDILAVYYNFYNGYVNPAAWSGWRKMSTQTIA